MYTPQQIVVPIDFSDASRVAARRAVVLAEAFDTPMHLVHALGEPFSGIYSNLKVPPGIRGTIREQAAEKLGKFESELPRERAQVTTELVEEDPVSAIQDAVTRHASNLIVMGTHGSGGARRLFIGSVAERTLRSVDCPTLTVKDTLTGSAAPIRRLLFATDFSSHSERAASSRSTSPSSWTPAWSFSTS